MQTSSAPSTLPNVPGDPVVLPKVGRISSVRATFGYPADFVEGHYDADAAEKGVDESLRGFFSEAFVLIESSRATGRDLQKLPIGLPLVSVHHLKPAAMKVFTSVIEPEWRTTISGHDVVKMPGLPAPFGERSYCYLMPRADGTGVLLVAPRKTDDKPVDRQPTHYDWVIERIIASWREER